MNLYLNWQRLISCCWYDSYKHRGCNGDRDVRDGGTGNHWCYKDNQTSCPDHWQDSREGCYNYFTHEYAPTTGGSGKQCYACVGMSRCGPVDSCAGKSECGCS